MGFLSELSDFARRAMPAAAAANDTGEWEALFGQTGAGAGIPLGTARWMAPEAAIERFRYPGSPFDGRIWIGEGLDWERSPWAMRTIATFASSAVRAAAKVWASLCRTCASGPDPLSSSIRKAKTPR